MTGETETGLYGLVHSSRNGEFWTKNKFNSAFPAALACYMRDRGLPATFVCLSDGKIENVDLQIDDLFGTKLPNEELYFRFEGSFADYANFQLDETDGVDLIISEALFGEGKRASEGKQLRALEVKLTVVPDSATDGKPEDKWSSEIVLRPATTQYCMMSFAQSCARNRDQIRQIFEPKFGAVNGWNNETAAKEILVDALDALEQFELAFSQKQKPLILQPIWKTLGKCPDLADLAFDLFVWSDFAYARLLRDQARRQVKNRRISRSSRGCLRLVRALFEFGQHGKPHMKNIKDDMSYGRQNDKETSANGGVTRKYLISERLQHPRIPKEAIDKIVIGDGATELSPERRFDQTIMVRALKQEIVELERELVIAKKKNT